MSNVIETRHLTVRRAGRTVLSNVHLRIAQGEFVAIVGRSGVGKSTLLHALAGHLPFEGEIIIPKNIGMVFQQYAVFPWLTAAQNIGFGLQSKGMAKTERICECLRITDLEEKADSYPATLSGGQQQRIAIARAIAHRPKALLMDEPFGSLDAYTREQMQAWLLNIRRTYETTVVLVTHDIEEALILADRIVVLTERKLDEEFSEFHAPLRGIDAKYSDRFLQMRKKIAESLSK